MRGTIWYDNDILHNKYQHQYRHDSHIYMIVTSTQLIIININLNINQNIFRMQFSAERACFYNYRFYQKLEQFCCMFQFIIMIKMYQKRIGDYKITKTLIGKGSFGSVYKGLDTVTNTAVAVKIIERSRLHDQTLEYFDREIAALKNCDSEFIVKLHSIRKTTNNCYLFLEYCNQGDLSEYIAKKGKLSQEQALKFFYQIVSGFKTIVKCKLIHRDLKPANIFLKDGQVKIGDFGLSKLLAEKHMANTFAGSPFNMAPEVLNHKEYDNRVDIYGIGTVLYEMLFGSPPFVGHNVRDIVSDINNRKLSNFDKKLVSAETLNLLGKLLKADPAQRMTWEELFMYEQMRTKKQQRLIFSKYQQFMNTINAKYLSAIPSIFCLYNSSKAEKLMNKKHWEHQLSTSLFVRLIKCTQYLE